MSELSIRITHRAAQDCNPTETTIELGKASELLPQQSFVDLDSTWAGNIGGHTKVLPSGVHVDGSDPRTDHAAVIDHATGLMWSVESLGDDSGDSINQAGCEARCKALRLLGFDDWRLPTRAELAGLVDDTRHEPAIDTSLFPRVKQSWHWTSTAAAWSSVSAWGVDFSFGYVDGYPRYDVGFALAVRRAGQ